MGGWDSNARVASRLQNTPKLSTRRTRAGLRTINAEHGLLTWRATRAERSAGGHKRAPAARGCRAQQHDHRLNQAEVLFEAAAGSLPPSKVECGGNRGM